MKPFVIESLTRMFVRLKSFWRSFDGRVGFWMLAPTFISLFFSCEKVLDLDLKTSPSQLVIQGNVYDQPGPYIVKITRSVDFDVPSVYPGVRGATVSISDDVGHSEFLTEDSAGIYKTVYLEGVPGRCYTLRVELDGQVYTATSTMPEAVELDSIYLENSIFPQTKQVGMSFSDPPGVKNYYRLIDFINEESQESFIVVNDVANDGKTVNGSLMYADEDLESGDLYGLWLECVDKGVYDYFRTAEDYSNGQVASPSNPLSNISNGALGYFNACTLRKKTMIMP